MNPKKYICDAMLELLKEKHFDKITVKDLIERAQVSRSTFYNHFTDKYEIIDWYCGVNVQKILSQTMQENSWYPIFLKLNQFTEKNKFFFKTMYMKDSTKTYHAGFHQFLYKYLEKNILTSSNTKVLTQAQELELLYIAKGTQEILQEWIIKDLPFTAKEISDIAYQMIPYHIKVQIER